MTYTGQSPILGQGTATAEQIDRWFQLNAARGAQYVDLPRIDPPPLGVAIISACSTEGVNSDIVAAQCAHESAWWQSKIARDKNNPAGIGAENDDPYGKAITFATPLDGIAAQVAHLLTYVKGDGYWTVSDPRYQAVKDAGWLGTVDVLDDLNGKWAYPGRTYGAELARKANELLAIGDIVPQPTEPPIRVMLLPEGASNRPGHAMTPTYITIHETGNPSKGANAEMHSRYIHGLAKAGKDEPSWHFTVDDFEIVQHLPLDENGWHAGDGAQGTGNRKSIGIELCVNSDGNFTATQNNAAWLVAKLHREQPSLAGLNLDDCVVQHNHWSGKDCPHNLRAMVRGWEMFMTRVRLAAGTQPEPAPEPPPADDALWLPHPDKPGEVWPHPFVLGFRAYVTEMANTQSPLDLTAGVLAFAGYPQEDEFLAVDGCTYQVCERLRLQYNPENAPPFDVLPMPRKMKLPKKAP